MHAEAEPHEKRLDKASSLKWPEAERVMRYESVATPLIM